MLYLTSCIGLISTQFILNSEEINECTKWLYFAMNGKEKEIKKA